MKSGRLWQPQWTSRTLKKHIAYKITLHYIQDLAFQFEGHMTPGDLAHYTDRLMSFPHCAPLQYLSLILEGPFERLCQIRQILCVDVDNLTLG